MSGAILFAMKRHATHLSESGTASRFQKSIYRGVFHPFVGALWLGLAAHRWRDAFFAGGYLILGIYYIGVALWRQPDLPGLARNESRLFDSRSRTLMVCAGLAGFCAGGSIDGLVYSLSDSPHHNAISGPFVTAVSTALLISSCLSAGLLIRRIISRSFIEPNAVN